MADLAVESVPAEATERKFGTFLGVFTPSLLTILGVIMYQRFGWVVGNAGLVGALGIVFISHVISVTTGLSVASIATNHKVGAGGNYYIISRSLGLSIGGAIGLALYFALALSVSLYLIGFAEAFLAATDFNPWGWVRKDNIRFIGSVACAAIAIVTLLSTSVALKSQLIVLTLILLSLVSLFAGIGFGDQHGTTPVTNYPVEGAESIETVFAVFFPAVTGFTAGVGMSGDLRDPKRAIPIGTMAAIAAGFAIYITLPWFIAERASVEDLRQNYDVFLQIARWPILVSLGVAAATISSALGSILGAPRTLQALAKDGIAHRIFARGKDEPRVALVATIVIAEAGILIGELEIVGAVISMFFLTCYGFLCLACGLERWASPDFRPQFKVPIWVSLLGAVACFLVMFQIDAVSMFASIAIMGLLYARLKRRQLVLGSGDTWGGVWSAVVRTGLIRLRQTQAVVTQANWRPNMVVMARRSRQRRDLIEFGRSVVGGRGILTHFDLVTDGPPRGRVDEQLESEYPGMFARIQGCDDVFETIPAIAANFGFVGMETNVILLGWPRDVSHNEVYTTMIGRLLALDLSVLMLRFDADRGFGKHERIDIWWDGVAPTGQLMLTIAHLLMSDPLWKNARVRLLVNGRPGVDDVAAQRRLEALLTSARINADGVLLPPLIDEAALADRIRQESGSADLVMIHALEDNDSSALGSFVAANDALIRSIGTALLVRPSSDFSDAAVIFDTLAESSDEIPAGDVIMKMPAHSELAAPVMKLTTQLAESVDRFVKTVQEPAFEEETQFLAAVVKEVSAIRQVERRLLRRGARREAARGLIDWAKNRYGSAVIELTADFTAATKSKKLEDQVELAFETPWQRRFRDGLGRLRGDMTDILVDQPVFVLVRSEKGDWAKQDGDPMWFRLLKLRVRLAMMLGFSPPARRVPVRALVTELLGPNLTPDLERAALTVGLRRFDTLIRARRLSSDVARFFSHAISELDQLRTDDVDIEPLRELVRRELAALEESGQSLLERQRASATESEKLIRGSIEGRARTTVEALGRTTVWLGARTDGVKNTRVVKRSRAALDEMPFVWERQHAALSAASQLDVQGGWLSIEARRALSQLFHRVRREIEAGPIAAFDRAHEILEQVRAMHEADEVRREDDSGEYGVVDDSGEVDAPDLQAAAAEEAERRDAYLKAADALRATWEEPYRPSPRDLMDQLLAGLGRAADRVPESVITFEESAFEAAIEGRPERAPTSYPARRLAQAFLEKRVAAPVRATLRELPERVGSSQEQLIDAVRLIAFDLEQHALGRSSDDPEDAAAFVLGGVLSERMTRLQNARQELAAFVEQLEIVMLVEPTRALEDVRSAITAGTTAASAGPRVDIQRASGNVAQTVVKAYRVVGKGVGSAVGRVSGRGGHVGNGDGTLADELLTLRSKLVPRPEVQASLPLIYRRIFGRAPLENSDLLCGRDLQLKVLERTVRRWKSGVSGPVAIIGDPRSGKTTLANILMRELLSEHTSVRVGPPPGNECTADALNEAVVRAVGGRKGQGAEIALRAMPPGAVLLVEDLGRWIERAPGGLAALRAWHQLWRRLGDRHLFVVTTTPYVWRYVSQLTSVGESFLDQVSCDHMSRADLQQALQIRQRTSDFELDFADDDGGLGRALSFGDPIQFRRLHDRTSGNVGDALDLWRRSIVGVSERRIAVSVGASPDVSVLKRLPLRWYGALGAIAVHRAVTTARMGRLMRSSREDAAGLLADLERAGLVVPQKGGVWTLDPVFLPDVLAVLRSRIVINA